MIVADALVPNNFYVIMVVADALYQIILRPLTHLSLDNMASILQMAFSNAFSWLKILEFQFKFNWKLFLSFHFTISQHWFRQWLGTQQVTNHYLNQCWLNSLTHTCSTRVKWVKQTIFDRDWEVVIPPVFFFRWARFSHSNAALCPSHQSSYGMSVICLDFQNWRFLCFANSRF